jgi:hypothetical protein
MIWARAQRKRSGGSILSIFANVLAFVLETSKYLLSGAAPISNQYRIIFVMDDLSKVNNAQFFKDSFSLI